MILQTFFEKFDLFADVPDAVAKMRELVLDLAVRGRLFGKAVEAEADWLPNGWHQRQLGEVAQFINGDRSKNYPSKSFRVDDGVPFINAGHLSNGDVDLINMDYITPEHFDRLGGGKVQPGDVLYCLRGSLGKCAVVQSINRGAIASSLLIIRPSQQIASRFIFLFLTSPLGARMIAKYDNGSAQPNLSAANVKKYIVPLPPLAEQKRIVAKVDELMALCDRLEAQQQERETRHAALARASLARFADAPTPANLPFLFHPAYAIAPADLRKSILTLAVQGRLVPQDPNDEPAEELLERVASALPDRTSENPFLGAIAPSITDESEYELPPGWTWLPLGHVGIWATGCGFPMQYQGETAGEFLFCKVSDMNLPGNEVEIHTTVHKIDADVMKKIRARANPVGTVIFPKIGGAIATHKRRLVTRPTIIDNNCSGIQPIGLTDDSWLLLFLRNLDLTKYQSGTSVPAVSQGSLDPIRIGLPPLAEQRRIVAKVKQLMALVDELETHLAASRATGEKLLAALVAELTAGKESHATA
jgi:type I restriction enzyme, S subunit